MQLNRNFSQDVEITIGTNSKIGQHVFSLQARGSARFGEAEHPATVKLEVALAESDKDIGLVSWPRGVYRIGGKRNQFRVEMPEANAGTYVATEAYLLVPYATSKRIEGSIHLVKAFRPFAPMAVPQTGLPVRFTFSEQKQ